MITIKQAETVFYVGDSAKQPLAEMTFVYAGDNIIIIDHTSVADELRGQNIGKQLLEKLIGFAREKNKKIIVTSIVWFFILISYSANLNTPVKAYINTTKDFVIITRLIQRD